LRIGGDEVAKKRISEETKQLLVGQKLGCQLSPDASALLGALEYTLNCGSGVIVTRAIVALIDALPDHHVVGITAMMRIRGASLSRLKRSLALSETPMPSRAGEESLPSESP
jgi:hypothetical protein